MDELVDELVGELVGELVDELVGELVDELATSTSNRMHWSLVLVAYRQLAACCIVHVCQQEAAQVIPELTNSC